VKAPPLGTPAWRFFMRAIKPSSKIKHLHILLSGILFQKAISRQPSTASTIIACS
jgi:hypothetical protein